MTAEEYVQHFNMNQPDYEFSREAFIDEFRKDFMETLERLTHYSPDRVLPYPVFRDTLVRGFYDKYWAISRARKGPNLTKGLWNAFFKLVVVPYRTQHYPEVQAKITLIKLGCYENNNRPKRQSI